MLYLIPTPLAPDAAASSVVPIIAELVKNTPYFFVEELRTARRFISSLKTGVVIDELVFWELNKDSDPQKVLKQIKFLKTNGHSAIVLSEAGCPGIADPGAMAVKFAHQVGLPVNALPGPNSMVLTLMGSGFNGQAFTFNGYLPVGNPGRVAKLKELEKELYRSNTTQLFMETPYRNMQMFESMMQALAPETLVCVGANLTAPDQILITKSVKEWKKDLPKLHKIPAIFAIGLFN
jgi:16S rRNA (cytidine1402-2'-O)-methyltransferase